VAVLPMAKIVFRNLLTKPATRLYPFVAREAFPTSRGRIVIDFPACIFCSVCEKHCPADAIAVDKAAKLWRMDRFACVICGACVRVCPKKCLGMSPERWKAVDASDLGGRVEEHRTASPAAAALGAGAADA
jgi:formate hydrogenlyase subunit 6/NADH:ubiquinone oxidoreductase subunit I